MLYISILEDRHSDAFPTYIRTGASSNTISTPAGLPSTRLDNFPSKVEFSLAFESFFFSL